MNVTTAQHPTGRAMVAPPTSAAAFDATRPEVFQLLMRSPAFLGLPADERRRIAGDTVRVLSYMTDPDGVHSDIAVREARGDLPRSGALAESSVARDAPGARALADDPGD